MRTGILVASILFALAVFFTVPSVSFAQDTDSDTDRTGLPQCPVGSSVECDNSSSFHGAISGPFFQSDSVAIGTVIQKEISGEDLLAYMIDVDFYLKNYQPFDLLTVTLDDPPPAPQKYPQVWYYNSPIFSEGDLVFVYLVKNDGIYELLPESFALDKQEGRGPPPDILMPQSPPVDTFLQGEQILVSGDVRKMELVKAAKNNERLDVELTLHLPYDTSKTLFSGLTDINTDGHYSYHLDTSEIPAGEYQLAVKYGPSSTGTDITIVFNPKLHSPLKQLKSGVPSDEIHCREPLVLVSKNNGSPACVKESTLLKLAERGLILTSVAERDLMLNAGYKMYPGVGWAQTVPSKPPSTLPDPDTSASSAGLEVDVTGQQQVRRGTTHDIVVDVFRDANPVPGALVRITIEDYGDDVIRDFKGRTDDSGRFVFSWEIPKRFDDIKTLLAYVDVTDDVSAKTVLFKFQVYCHPAEAGCKVKVR